MIISKKTVSVPDKRTVDMRVVSEWVEPGSRVLDLGCGRGVLLEYLIQTKSVFGVGVDLDPEKIRACVRKGVPVYHGDITEFMKTFDDRFFDRVICSRTVQELNNPAAVISEGLRV
ncbi:MAG: methionine biosynthesis protein MetW, partial [Opitutales bacterium]